MTRLISLRYLFLVPLLLAAGCKREQIRVYVVPKDTPAQNTAAQDPHGADPHGADPHGTDPHGSPGDAEEAQIGWQLPDGWRETKASSVNFASFSVPSSSGGEANVAVSHFPNIKDREPFLINMWREQVSLSPLPEAEAAKAFTPATVAGQPGLTFEVVGTREGKPIRIVTAILHRGETSWFFKLAGDQATVDENKEKFLEFAKTIRFAGPDTAPPETAPPQTADATPPPSTPPAPPVATTPPPGPLPQPKWSLPAGWTALTPGQMQIAKFSVPEQNGAKAEVAVSVFPSDTGGMLANVNRWRAQLGLPPTDDAGIAPSVQNLDGGGSLIDLTNEQRQIVGAIVPRDGRWWFYKMIGDTAAVAAAKDAFVQFAKTAP